MFGFFLVSVFCFLLKKQNNYLKRKLDLAVRMNKNVTGDYNDLVASKITDFVSKFFQDTKITNHIIQLSKDNVDIKVGDDEVMVKVDQKLLKVDIIEALYRAQLKWKKLKNRRKG